MAEEVLDHPVSVKLRMTEAAWGIPDETSQLGPGKQNCEQINSSCFKPLSSGVVSYTVLFNYSKSVLSFYRILKGYDFLNLN